MPKHSRMTVLNTLIQSGLIPLFFDKDPEVASQIVQACLDGGARCVEFTNRGDQAHLVFEQLARRYEGEARLVLGAGSIVDPGTAISSWVLISSSGRCSIQTSPDCATGARSLICPAVPPSARSRRLRSWGSNCANCFPGASSVVLNT